MPDEHSANQQTTTYASALVKQAENSAHRMLYRFIKYKRVQMCPSPLCPSQIFSFLHLLLTDLQNSGAKSVENRGHPAVSESAGQVPLEITGCRRVGGE